MQGSCVHTAKAPHAGGREEAGVAAGVNVQLAGRGMDTPREGCGPGSKQQLTE